MKMDLSDLNPTSDNSPDKKWRKYCAILGSFLLIIPSGIYSMWGNISVYALSYAYVARGMSRGLRTPWEVSAYLMSMYVGYNTSGYIMKCCRKQLVLFSIILISNGGFFTAYFALKYHLISLAVSVVFVLGFSIGVVESVVFKYIADWSGNKKGYLISIACSGMNFGPFLVNPIVTAYVNYGNLSPNVEDCGLMFITQGIVLEKVPSLFLLLGSMFLGIQLVGFLLLNLHEPCQEPPPPLPLSSSLPSSSSPSSSSSSSSSSSPSPDINKLSYGSVSKSKKEDRVTNACEKEGESDTINKNEPTETPEPCTEIHEDFTPSQILCSSVFYILWLCNACRDCSTILLNSYYKSFGQNWIRDDYLLTAVGSVLGITGGFVRLTWGFVLDRYNLKTCLIAVFSLVTSSMLFMYYSPALSKYLYFADTVFYASIHSCLFPTVVSSTLVLFGQTHFNQNLGLVNTASMLADIVAPLAFEAFLSHYGWFWIFGSTVSLFSLTLVTVIFKFPYARKKADVQNKT